MTARERRINELRRLIPSIKEEIGVEDIEDSSLLSELDSKINCLEWDISELEEELDQKQGELNAYEELRDLKKELDKLDPPYIPAKYKPRPEISLTEYL